MREVALPSMGRIAAELKRRHPDVPLMVFPRGAAYANAALGEAGFDVLTLDGASAELTDFVTRVKHARHGGHFPLLLTRGPDTGTVPRAEARAALPPVCLQGDFDPSLLVEVSRGRWEGIYRGEVRGGQGRFRGGAGRCGEVRTRLHASFP